MKKLISFRMLKSICKNMSKDYDTFQEKENTFCNKKIVRFCNAKNCPIWKGMKG